MKKTAVEFYVSNIKKYEEQFNKGEISIKVLETTRILWLEKAKEMEKQQIIDCGNTCALLQHIHEDKVNKMSLEELEKYAGEDVITFGEQYYNETFISE